MLFRFALYFSLSLFGAGLIYKLVSWFRCPIGDQSRGISPLRRFSSAVRGLAAVLFGRRVLLLGKIFFADVLLQLRLKKEGSLRWFMHLTLFYGFLFLLFFHALDRHITIKLFPEYVSTLNPFFFLRNFFGALLLLGLAIAAYRRFRDKVLRLTTGRQDLFALVLLGVIILSGFFLEASKIVSPQRFQEMNQEYAFIQDDRELQALRAYWSRDFGVVFPGPEIRPDPELLKKGKGPARSELRPMPLPAFCGLSLLWNRQSHPTTGLDPYRCRDEHPALVPSLFELFSGAGRPSLYQILSCLYQSLDPAD